MSGHPRLFENARGEMVHVPARAPRMAERDHAALLRRHGTRDRATCGACVFLTRHIHGARWLKCAKARVTGSTATDWRASWQACGLYAEAP